MKTEKQKMLAGELYRPDEELGAEQAAAKAWMARYNAALALPVSERHALLCERLGHVGKDAVIRPPFFCDYGFNIRLGAGAFLNFNCVILDVVDVTIGEGTRHLITPGSIGQPRDNDWRAAFAIYDTEAQEIVFHRVPYDLTAAQGRILMAGLPEKLALRLRDGR